MAMPDGPGRGTRTDPDGPGRAHRTYGRKLTDGAGQTTGPIQLYAIDIICTKFKGSDQYDNEM
jgi:hypothetical protein